MNRVPLVLVRNIFIVVFTLALTFSLGVGLGLFSLISLNKNQNFSFGELWSNLRGTKVEDPQLEPPTNTTADFFLATESAALRAETATHSSSLSVPSNLSRITVLNATNIAGKAGSQAEKLRKAKLGTVIVGNSAATYELGNYIFLPQDSLLGKNTVESILGIELREKSEIPQLEGLSQNDVVIVISE